MGGTLSFSIAKSVEAHPDQESEARLCQSVLTLNVKEELDPSGKDHLRMSSLCLCSLDRCCTYVRETPHRPIPFNLHDNPMR